MFQRIHGIRHVRIRIVKFSTSTTHRAKKRYHQDYLKKNEKSPEWASSRTPGRRKEIKPFTLNIPKAYTEGDGTDPSENGNNLGQIIEAITKEPEFEWWSAFANQSTHITNTPDTEKQKVTYSYLAAQAETRVKAQDIPKAAIEKEMAPDTAVRYILRVNDRRLNLLLPPLDITKAWNLLKPTDITLLNNRLQHIEKLGRNSHIIKASQILYIQKYHLEPPKGRTLQLLENEFKKELEQQNLIETRLILETKTTRGNMTSSTREELTRTHHTFFVYLGLATIEDPKKLAPQVIYRFLKRCKHETLHQSLWDSQKVEFEVENLNALESINDSLKDYIEPCKLNEIVFTSLLRPIILTFNNENLRLPSLPNVREATKFSYLMQVIFGPIAKSSSSDSLAIPHNLLLPPDLNERILRVSDSLDKVGDRLLWVLSQEYFLQRTSLFESLTRSNELLGRLVYLYDFLE